jgi:hypothetical protein
MVSKTEEMYNMHLVLFASGDAYSPPNLSSIFIYNPPVHASDNLPSFPFPIIWGNTIHFILRRMT